MNWNDLRKRKKLKLSGRVGISFENQKKAQQISVKIPKCSTIEEEIITIDDEATYDEPLQPSSTTTLTNIDSAPVFVPDTICVDVDNKKKKDHLKRDLINVEPSIIEKTKISKKDPRPVILKNGCHTLSYIDLLLLETNHPTDQLSEIKSVEPGFRTGWLTDSVVDSFVSNILINKQQILHCGAIEALTISRGLNFRLLWKGLDIAEKNAVLIPLNLNGWHWTLIYMDIVERNY